MALLYRDGSKPPLKALEIILGYMNRVHQPVFIGYIALEVGYSLARTQDMLELLEDQGRLHKLNEIELKTHGFRSGSNVYGLGPKTM